jgi:hypothetical protein
MSRQQHRFHGDPQRFDALAAFIAERYGDSIRYIADVAGGQGMLSRLLNKRFNYESEVVDPREWVLRGVPHRAEPFRPDIADFYDLIVGLHADQATRPVAEAARLRPAILVPCCNFWSADKLGQDELLAAIEAFYADAGVRFERVRFDFKGPKNVGLVSEPSGAGRFSAKTTHRSAIMGANVTLVTT